MLILLPSGQTQADVDKVFLGRGDSPITTEGINQIKDAAETLSVYPINHIYSSDLYRAQEALRTVLKANRHTTTWELVEELRERSGGSYEGKKYTDVRKGMSPKAYKVWERDPFEAPEHGESLVDVQDRLHPWWKEEVVPKLHDNETILIISHPDVIRVLIALARNDDLADSMSMIIEPGLPIFYSGPVY